MIKNNVVWKNILQLNKVGDIVKTDGTPHGQWRKSRHTNPGEPGVGIQWISHYHKMQEKTQKK